MTTTTTTRAFDPGIPGLTDSIAYAHALGRGQLTEKQMRRLVKAIDPGHVETKQGLSYIAQHEARAEMTRIFGFGNWDSNVLEMRQAYEYSEQGTGNNASKTYWITGYAALVQVRIRDLWGMPIAEFSEWHFEENAKQPNRGEANALAMTSVESYALRRALIGLGDRLGLGLYEKGSTAALVKGTLQLTELFPAPQQPQAPVSGPNDPTAGADTRTGEIASETGAQPQPDPRLQGAMNPGSNA